MLILKRFFLLGVCAILFVCGHDCVQAAFDVRQFGAVGNGQTLDTVAINRAVEACAKAGGGTVLFPPGRYVSGSIRLKSNMTLYLESGAVLVGAPGNIKAYDLPEPVSGPGSKYQDFGHNHFHNSLIWGEGLENVTLAGGGMIDGGGIVHGRDGDPPPGGANKTVALKKCRNVVIRDLTIYKAGHFALLLTGCNNVTMRDLTIDTDRDAIDVDCCRNVLIDGCKVNTEFDDGIVCKTTFALGERRACENIVIVNCILSGFKVGTMLDGRRLTETPGIGGIKFGTESKGDFRKVIVSNCIFDHCKGFALNSVDGAVVEDIQVSNLVMKDVSMEPIFLRLGRRMWAPPGTPIGKLRRVRISDVAVQGGDRLWGNAIMGIKDHPIEDIEIRNVTYISQGGGTSQEAALQVPLAETEHPWIPFFRTVFPDYGFFCRNVKGLSFQNVHLGFDRPDQRPALVCEDVSGLKLDQFSFDCPPNGQAPIVFRNVRDLSIYDSPQLAESQLSVKSMIVQTGVDDRQTTSASVRKQWTLFKQAEQVAVGQAFKAAFMVRADKAGLAKMKLMRDADPVATEYAWFDRNEEKEVVFSGLKVDAPGTYRLSLNQGEQAFTLKVR